MVRNRNNSECPLINGDPSKYYDSTNDSTHPKVPPSVDYQNNLTSEPTKDGGIHLKKQLGVLDGVAVIVGIMVGSGIFISPTGVVQYTHSVGMALIVWAISGIITIFGALCYAELGTMIPKSGGEYTYISEAWGELPGFMYLWISLVFSMPTGNAVISLTFAHYIIKPIFPDCVEPPIVSVKLVAAIVVCFITWINCANAKIATKLQDIFTVTKILALLVIILAGFYHLATGNTDNYEKPFEHTIWSIGSMSMALYQGLFSFAGWNCLNYVVEELKDPHRNLPLAIMISLPIVSIVYFLTNVSYFAVLTPKEMMASSAVAVTFGNKILGSVSWLIPFFVACSSFGCLNGAIFASSRLYFVGAREGQLPDSLALINVEAFTPVPSLITLCLMTLVMLLIADVQLLINFALFSESLVIFASITGLLWLRYNQPQMYRPIKLWIGLPIIFFVASLLLVVVPILVNPSEFGIVLGIILLGIPLYYACVRQRDPYHEANSLGRRITTVVQLITKGLPEN